MRILPVLGSLIVALAAFAGPSAASAAQCLDGFGPALVAGGFSGSVDCKNDELSLKHVGRVQEYGRTFQIYSYRYRLKPACPDCAVHGGHRIIFMEGGRYVGQYKSDFAEVAMKDNQLVLMRSDFSDAEPVAVRFTEDGPPKRVWDGGEVLLLFR